MSLREVSFSDLQLHNNLLNMNSNDFFRQLIIASNRWANSVHKEVGYPNFIINNNIVQVMCFYDFVVDGRIGRRGNTFYDIRVTELEKYNSDFNRNDFTNEGIIHWARATNRFADAGKFPYGNFAIITGEVAGEGNNQVRGAHGLRMAPKGKEHQINDDGRYIEISEETLAFHDSEFKMGIDNRFDIWTRAVFKSQKGATVFPNYEIGPNRVYGAYRLF